MTWEPKTDEKQSADIVRELNESRDIALGLFNNEPVNAHSNPFGLGQKQNNLGDQKGSVSHEPKTHTITDVDDNGTATGVFDKIDLESAFILVDHSSSSIDLRYIQKTVKNGQKIYIKPVDGKTLTLKTGGNIDIASDITVNDNELMILLFDKDSNITADGGYIPHKSGAGAGAGDNLGNHIATQDLLMDEFNILAANSVTFGNSAIDSFNRAISVASGVLRYSIDGTLLHQFRVGLDDVLEIGTTEIDIFKPLNLNSQTVRNVDLLDFDRTDMFIQSSILGLDLGVQAIDDINFFVDVNLKMGIENNEIEMYDTLRMNNEDIQEIQALRFDDGQIINTSLSELLIQVLGGDTIGMYVAASKVVEINSDELEMQLNKLIDFGANISLTASAGFQSLPANPVGFINCVVNGSDARVPYYGT